MQNGDMFHRGLHKKNSIASMLVLCTLTVYSRCLFKANYLYEWDSVQFALSTSKFDIMWHRPHPPGYIFYVFFIKGANLLFQSPNSSIVFTNIFFSIVTLVIFYKLCLLFFGDAHIAFITAVMLIANPVFWFYSSTGTVYVMEAFITMLMGYSIFLSMNSSDLKYLAMASFFLGVMGGFRQTAVLLLAPLWFYALSKKIRNYKELLIMFTIFFVSILTWLLPTINNTGGLENYLNVSRGLTSSSSEKIQTIFGGINNYLITDILNFSVWFLQCLSPIGLGIILIVLWSCFGKYGIKKILKNEKAVFVLLWTVPPTLVYLVYIEKPGYLLTIVPPLLILLSWSVVRITSGIRVCVRQAFFKYGVCCFILLIFTAWFIWPSSKEGIPQKINSAALIIQPPLSDYNWDVSSREIRQKDYAMMVFTNILRNNDKYRSSNVVIFWAGGYPTWRHIMYYFPDYKSYWLVDESVSGKSTFNCEYYVAKDRIESSYSGLPFWVEGQRPRKIDITLDKNIKWLIWVLDEKTDVFAYVYNNYSNELIDLPNGQMVMITPNIYDMMDLGCFIIR